MHQTCTLYECKDVSVLVTMSPYVRQVLTPACASVYGMG